MTTRIIFGLAIAVVVALVLFSRYEKKLRRKQPIWVNLNEDPLLPYGQCMLAKRQISCCAHRIVGLSDSSIQAFQFPAQKREPGMTLQEVIDAFNMSARDPLAPRPLPVHPLQYYLEGALHLPKECEGKNLVFVGTLWDSQREGRFVQAIGPDTKGNLIEKTFGDEKNTHFTADFYFAVFVPKVPVPHGVLTAERSVTA